MFSCCPLATGKFCGYPGSIKRVRKYLEDQFYMGLPNNFYPQSFLSGVFQKKFIHTELQAGFIKGMIPA